MVAFQSWVLPVLLGAAASAFPHPAPGHGQLVRRLDPTYTTLGCHLDPPANRALKGKHYAKVGMTAGYCATLCADSPYFGTLLTYQCYCGDNFASSAAKTDEGNCNSPCSGDIDQSCGGTDTINLYVIRSNVVVAPGLVDGFTYQGCFVDSAERILPERKADSDDMTAAMCAEACVGYEYFDVQYSKECYCGNEAPTSTAPEGDCNFLCGGSDLQYCGGFYRASVYKRNPPPTPALVDRATYLGCFVDSIERVLPVRKDDSDTMTAAMCADACVGYGFFGVQYSKECYCGNEAPTSTAPEDECSYLCSGNAQQICGGFFRVTAYKRDPPPVIATVEGAAYLGCFIDDSERALPVTMDQCDSMTAAGCAEACAGYQYFGVEYGRECYCGPDAPTEDTDETQCSSTCAGNDEQICGGFFRLTTYRRDPPPTPAAVEGAAYLGCFVDNPEHVLPIRQPDSDTMTAEQCAEACAGYQYFGVQYSKECYCGRDAPTDDADDESECSYTCAGDYGDICGGNYRLTAYRRDPLPVPATVEGAAYQGCFVDNAERVLPVEIADSDTLTAEKCSEACAGYQYFGVEYGKQCYCGPDAPAQSAEDESECSYTCAGDIDHICGGFFRLTAYRRDPPPAPAPVDGATYLGCFVDSLERVLPTNKGDSDAMTAAQCSAACARSIFFGVENGRECYCGSSPPTESTDASECSYTCTGNFDQICGGFFRLSAYRRNPPDRPRPQFPEEPDWGDVDPVYEDFPCEDGED